MVKGLVSRARFSCLCHLLLGVWLQTSDFTHHSASGTLIVPALGEGQGVGWIEHLVKGCYCHSPEIPWSPGCSGGSPGVSDLAPFPSGTDSICHPILPVECHSGLGQPSWTSQALLPLTAPGGFSRVCLLGASSCSSLAMVRPTFCSSPPCFWTECLGW